MVCRERADYLRRLSRAPKGYHQTTSFGDRIQCLAPRWDSDCCCRSRPHYHLCDLLVVVEFLAFVEPLTYMPLRKRHCVLIDLLVVVVRLLLRLSRTLAASVMATLFLEQIHAQRRHDPRRRSCNGKQSLRVPFARTPVEWYRNAGDTFGHVLYPRCMLKEDLMNEGLTVQMVVLASRHEERLDFDVVFDPRLLHLFGRDNVSAKSRGNKETHSSVHVLVNANPT